MYPTFKGITPKIFVLELEHCSLIENASRRLIIFHWCCNFSAPTRSESAKSRRSRVYVVCVGPLGAWVRFLRGLSEWNIFPCVQFFFAWVFALVKILYVGLKFLRRSTFFCVGQLLFTKRDYFTILQLIV